MKPYFSFQWHITDECDQRCKHCYIFSDGKHTCLKSMTWEQMQDAFYNCLDFCEVFGRTPYFYLTGGDPILHPDFWRLLELFHDHDIKFTILGNPFHLNDQVCRELKWFGCEKYQLSLDGLRETHDWFRKPGSYDCTLEKIKCINKAGLRSVIMTTVSKTNMSEITGIIDAVVEAGVNVFAFSRYVPSGGDLDASMTAQEYRSLLASCDKKFKEYEAEGCQTYFNKKDHLWTLYEYETGEFTFPENAEKGMIYGGCNCGACHITILPTGDIFACRRVADSKVGNVFEDRLDEGAVVCNTGVLGKVYEWNGFDPTKDIPNGVYLTGFFSNYPTQKMMQDIFCFMDEHHLKPLVGAIFDFGHIKEACIALDSGKVNGKIVVEV